MITERLAELGYTLDTPTAHNGLFAVAQRHGDLVYTSGQLPILGDEEVKGLVGADLTLEEGSRAAEICAFNCLRAVSAVADVESIQSVVKLLGMVNVAPGFTDTTGVVNGASRFLQSVLGERAGHARSAVGLVVPFGFAVEIEMIVALR